MSIGYEADGCPLDHQIVWHHSHILVEGMSSASHRSLHGLWNFNFLHHYDFKRGRLFYSLAGTVLSSDSGILELGDGTSIRVNAIPTISTVAGSTIGSEKRPLYCNENNCNGKEPLEKAQLLSAKALSIGPDGAIYFGIL